MMLYVWLLLIGACVAGASLAFVFGLAHLAMWAARRRAEREGAE